MKRRPIVVGIIGGVASGKSEVANQFVLRGASRINADELGHLLLKNDPNIQKSVEKLFGPTILNESKQIDRSKIASMVFGSDEQSKSLLEGLEAILHPAIRRMTDERLAMLRNQSDLLMIVLDAPLLIEAGWASLCDEIVFVDTPFQKRQQWAAQRGWPPEELARREATQLSLNEKRAVATRVVFNDGDIKELQNEIDELAKELRVES